MPIPLSLYIHLPWCVRKCPYCDFNSHEIKNGISEDLYVQALLDELEQHLPLVNNRPIISIFFGGGTPSLFSSSGIEQILNGVRSRLTFPPNIEITLEANPGTLDQDRFKGFFQAGVNRLSLGVQSLQDEKLKILGRIHDREHAISAIIAAKEVGFENVNIDLMYGLPEQSVGDALADLAAALSYEPAHISWYQLTIEPNTLFYHKTPVLPAEEMIWDMQQAGQALLSQSGFCQYEVSAYALPNRECTHNRNYWEFGDYLGIGAGAHSKITHRDSGRVTRFAQVKHPRDYLAAPKRHALRYNEVPKEDLSFEFMLNALRLTHGFPQDLFLERTGLELAHIEPILNLAEQRGLLQADPSFIMPSERGKRFLNNLMQLFLPS